MIRKLLATTALATVIATGAYAQDAAKPADATQPAATAADSAAAPTAGAESQSAAASGDYLQKLGSDQYLASNLDGKSIYPSTAEDAEAIGEIQNFLVGKDGTVVAAITDATVGDQSKVVAIPFQQISWSMDKDNEPRAVLSAGADSLAGAPAFTTPEEQASATADTAPASGDAASGNSMAPAGGTASTPAPAGDATASATPPAADADGGAAAPAADATATASASGSTGDYPATVGPDQYLTQNIIGQTVYSGPGDDAEKIGDINDIVLASSGKVEAGVIGVGGFLGIGEKDVAVPFDQFQMSRDQDNKVRVALAADKDQLKQAPAFSSDRDASADMASNGAAPATDAATTTGAAAGSAADSTQQAASDTADTAGGAMDKADDTASNMASKAGNATDNAATDTQQAANDTADTTGNAMSNAGAGATGAAAGAAAGTGMATADTSSSSAPADTTASTGGDSQSQQMTPVTDQSKLTADNLMGTTVYGPNDQTVGEIGDIALSEDGKVDAVIIDVGGFLGVGEKPVAVAMDNLKFMQDANGKMFLHTGFTQDQLNNAPEYKADSYADSRDTMRLENPGETSTSSNAGAGGAEQPAKSNSIDRSNPVRERPAERWAFFS